MADMSMQPSIQERLRPGGGGIKTAQPPCLDEMADLDRGGRRALPGVLGIH